MNTLNKFLRAGIGVRVGFLAALVLALAANAYGQVGGKVSRYTTTSFAGSFVDVSSGTYINDGDDNTYSFTGPPFAFNYDSVNYAASTAMSIQTNGYVGWTALGTDYNDGIGNFSTNPNSVNPFCCDLVAGGQVYGNGSSGGLYYTTTGSVGSRVFIIEWYNFETYNNGVYTSMEVKLYEGSNIIECLYLNHSDNLGIPADGNGGGTGLNGQAINSPNDYLRFGSSAQASTPSTDVRFTPPVNTPPQELTMKPYPKQLISGIPTGALNFGTATPNSPDTLYVTDSSCGAAGTTIHILGFSVSGASAYHIVSGPPVNTAIPQGTSVQYGIQFWPFNSGSLTGTFTIATDGRDSGTQVMTLTGVGAVPSVSYNGAKILFSGNHTELTDTSSVQYVYVTSNGIGPLTFKSFNFVGLNANNYFITHFPQNPLATGSTDSIGIRFAPLIEGEPDARLIIATNSANLPLDTILLQGFGILPHLAVGVTPPGTSNSRTNNIVAFDSVAIGDSVCQTITLSNPGSDTLTITRQIVTYGDYDFTFYPLTGSSTIIPPGNSQLVNVCFKPIAQGLREATLRFFTNIPKTITAPPVDTSQFVVNITGIGVPYGELVVTGPVVDTAIVGGTSHCITDTLSNVGLADLTVTNVSLTGPNKAAWSENAPTPLVIAAGTHVLVEYCYTASARGTQVDTIWFTGESSTRPFTASLPLTGVGAITCASAAPMNATFGATKMTLVGSMDTTCITVTNCGDIPAVYTAGAPIGAGYTVIPPLVSGTVAGGGTTEFCVVFTPTAIGAASGMLSLTGGPSPIADTLSGVGAGVTTAASGSLSNAVSLGACDSFPVTITNNGNVAWTPGAGMISGANASDFSISSGPTPAVVAANGGTAVVMIKFCPTMTPAGQESMTLTFPSESPVPLPTAFSYSTTATGTSADVTIKTEQDGFILGQSYPNPNNGTADVMVTLPQDARVQIDLIDLTGALVETAFTGSLPAGDQIVHLDAKGIPSGTYFYTLTTGNVRLTRELILLK